MKITALTGLILQVNKLIDSGEYNNISISDVHDAIDSQRLLRFIKEKCGRDVDFSIYFESTAYGDFEGYYEEKMNQLYNAYAGEERRKWGVEKLGLCLVLAWTNEIIQQGKGLQFS
jgi:hypothetical protein